MSAPATEAPAAPPPPPAAPSRPTATSFWRSTALPSLLSIAMALVVGAVLIAFSDDDVREAASYFFARPGDTLGAVFSSIAEAYGALFRGSVLDVRADSVVGALRPIGQTLLFATPLIAGGLAVAIPFKAGMFNIGAEGQIILAAIGAAYVGFAFDLPVGVHLVVAVAVGVLGGALWGAIPGALKATTGAHEVITTIMLNYVARFLILFLLGTTYFQREGRADPISPQIADTATLPALIPGFGRLNWAFVLVLAAAALAWWLVNRSTVGFRLRAVGANAEAARTAGMSVPRAYVTAMALAGGFAGLAGVSQVLGSERVLTTGISAGLGFDAITVALLGRANPVGVVAAGLLFGALKAGGLTMQAQTGTSLDIVVVLQALIVLFIAAPALISAIFRLRTTGAGVGQLSKGWNG
ncbi:ABC transporter permease [Aquipuribacter nitratireducens]|uniref:ABC transporter permease n=1 Tax=Aquipuribacter nitratireducens TaxID=650104 RepID=A0ABW0GN43_9MICO